MGVIRYFVVEDTKLPLKSVVPVWLLRRYPKLQNSQSHLVDSTCLHFGTFVLGNIQLAVTICKEFSGWHRPSHGVEKLIEIFSIVMKHQEKEEKKAFILEIARGGSLSAAVGSRRKLIKKWVLGCGVGLAAAVVMFSVFSLWQWRGSGDDTPVVSVAIAGLAVLPPGFERSLQNPFTATKLPEAGGNYAGAQHLHTVSHQATSSPFISFDASFAQIMGKQPSIRVLTKSDTQFAHEGAVWLPHSNEVFFASNLKKDFQGIMSASLSAVNIETGEWRQVTGCNLAMTPNGAHAYQDKILIAEQGRSQYEQKSPGGLVLIDPYSGHCEWMLNNFLGLPFNSPNDVIVTKNGAVWFTDPAFGSMQGFKGQPELGNFVWRYHPGNSSVPRVVGDGKVNLVSPNGLALSADESIMYISNSRKDPQQRSAIFAFEISGPDQTFLQNHRIFAYPDIEIPDGLKVDKFGNVWCACQDGLNAWNPDGDLVGKILIDGGVAQFTFAGEQQDVIIILNEKSIIRVDLGGHMQTCASGASTCAAGL